MDSGRCVSFKWEPPLEKFYFYGKFLANVKSHPYRGVEIDNRLRWKDHINQISNATNRTLGSEVSGTVWIASKRHSM